MRIYVRGLAGEQLRHLAGTMAVLPERVVERLVSIAAVGLPGGEPEVTEGGYPVRRQACVRCGAEFDAPTGYRGRPRRRCDACSDARNVASGA